MIHSLRNLGVLAAIFTLFTMGRLEAKICPGDTLYTQAEVDAFVSSGCDTIDGNLVIDGVDITDLSGLSHVKYVNGHLGIINTSILLINEAFAQLHTVNGDFFIEDNDELGATTEYAFPQLVKIGGALFIGGNDALFRLEGFASLASVGADLQIIGNLLLAHISAFPSLSSIDGALHIRYNGLLNNLDGFNALTILGDNLEIVGNSVLKSIKGFGKLASVDNLLITENPGLESITGFGALKSIHGDFIVYGNYEMVNLGGFYMLHEVLGEMHIIENPSLQFVTEFPVLESVNGLYVKYNSSLLSLSGFPLLKYIETTLQLWKLYRDFHY